ncbi:glycosyltransferase [Candidatus Saccharibacteria bacterium]|nr:glycosyltransferase [Candidatus Saccharibacteria bacterium]
MKKKISIIVPVYNTEKYLEKCLRSLVGQSYDNMEIILVDDGSTDNSGKICNEWAKKDKRIKAFHKKNGGLSDARNYGLTKATGEYVGFVDSDDWVDKDMYRSLMTGCEKYGTEIGWCNKIRVYSKKNKQESYILKKEGIDAERALVLLLLLSDPSACNKIFKKQLFDDIEFPKQKLYEDIGTIPYLIDKASRVYLDNIYGYYYNQQNDHSIVHERFTVEKMDYYYNVKTLNNFVIAKYPNLREVSECFFALSLTALITAMYCQRRQYKKQYKMLVKDLGRIKYKSNRYIPLYKKIMIFFDLHHMGWIVNIVKKVRG